MNPIPLFPPFEEELETDYLYSLLRLSKKLELAHDYPAIIKALTSEIEAVIGYHTAWVYMFKADSDIAYLLTAEESVGITDNIPTLDFSSDAFLREIKEADHTVIVEDATTDPRTNKEIVATLGNRSIINIPVMLADRKIGAIGTGSFGDEGVLVPTDSQLDYLSAMASHAAVALDRVRLFEERLEAEDAKRQMQEQVAHVQRLESLGVLAGGIAHDFNNILTAILGNIVLAEAQLSDDAPARTFLNRIGIASRRATDLCKQMLAYAGRRTSQPEPIDLTKLLHDMASLLEVSIGKQIELQYLLEEEIPPMLGDNAQIQQIMMNLITNANEAIGDESGTITVSTGHMYADKLYLNQLSYNHNAVPGDYVFFEISDTGCGMDQATREQLFDPFFTTKFTGRGLGMSAVIGIIQSHHGALALYSEPGQGSAFKVLFPTTDLPMPTPVDISEGPQLQHDYTVLVVDDEDIVRESTTSILDFMGFRSLAAESGEEAVQIVKQQPDSVDMVLLDMTMPGMNGVETFKALRAINSGLPVVLASGYSTADTIALFAEEKPNGFIQKPFIPGDLYAVLVKALEA